MTDAASERGRPPYCAGEVELHRRRPMVLIGLTDEGVCIWRCPKCLLVWQDAA